MFPVTCIAYLGRDQLTTEAKAAIREAWRTYYPLRGDTENHWVMYYTTMHLMAQLWPGEGEDRWFNSKTSDEITAVAAWVREGGALLLIADHMPFPGAAGTLASRPASLADIARAKRFYDAVLGTLGVPAGAVDRHRVFWRTPITSATTSSTTVIR